MESERDKAVSWADHVYGLARGWRGLYERMRAARRRSGVLRVLLAVPAGAHRVCTGLASRALFAVSHPLICCGNPWLWLRFPGRRVKSVLLGVTGLRSLAEAVAAGEEAGLRPFLAFGTLLGHCREGGFIAYDRDIDLGLVDADGAALGRLKAAMKARGWALKRQQEHLVSFVKPVYRSVTVDLFVFCVCEGEAHCTLGEPAGGPRFQYVYPPEVLGKLQPAVFAGKVATWIPERAAEFLSATYGDWPTPRARWHYLRDARNVRLIGADGASDGPRRQRRRGRPASAETP